MPIVDGLTSTKMIRAFEQEQKPDVEHGRPGLLTTLHRDHRVPIIAVSASLVEREKDTYVEAGFDGWILKPIDFRRLETLLHGIVDEQTRDKSLYVPGQWERGGWFKSGAKSRLVGVRGAGTETVPVSPISTSSKELVGLGLTSTVLGDNTEDRGRVTIKATQQPPQKRGTTPTPTTAPLLPLIQPVTAVGTTTPPSGIIPATTALNQHQNQHQPPKQNIAQPYGNEPPSAETTA